MDKEKDLVSQMNQILEKIAKVHQKQNQLQTDYSCFKQKVKEGFISFEESLRAVNHECESLYDDVDAFATEFSNFAHEFWKESPVLAGYSQDPYEDVDVHLSDVNEGQSTDINLKQLQAVSMKGNLQPQASISGTSTSMNVNPASGVKEIVLRPDYSSKPRGETSNPGKNLVNDLKNFQKRKSVSFSIDKPLSAWEKEYFDFSKMIYELGKTNTCFRLLDKNSIYPRMTCVYDATPSFVKKLADYGFLDRVYPKKNLAELGCFPESMLTAIKEFSEGENVYLRFYSISPELDGQTIYEPFHLITMGYVFEVQLKASETPFKVPYFNKKWMSYRRALGIKVIGNLCREFYEKGYVTFNEGSNWMIIMQYNETSRDPKLEEKIIQTNLDKWPGSPETIKEACRLLKHQHQASTSSGKK